MSQLRTSVLTARKRLAEGHESLRARHQEGASGGEVCAAIADLRDEILLSFYAEALQGLGNPAERELPDHLAMVACGGYGRRDVAPFSDVDLMILCDSGHMACAARLVERLVCDVFDAGLELGHSVRTVEEACQLAKADATIASSLIEARFLAGSVRLFDDFLAKFRAQLKRRGGAILAAMERARQEERIQYGETVFLLEPNVKRSRGGLRDLQLFRWAAAARYGTPNLDQLAILGVLARDDWLALNQAYEFLLRLRNELHFHAGRASDVLSRAEQVRIAALRGYPGTAGLLPVEQFMREYFRHTERVSHLLTGFLAKTRPARPLRRLGVKVLEHRILGGYRAGPDGIVAGKKAREKLGSSLVEVMNLVHLASLHDAPIHPETWEVVRLAAPRLPRDPEIPEDARRLFWSLLARPARLGELLRGLHDVGLLEYFIPEFAHARGLLQFNQYHKYTVDEHCLRAVEQATDLLAAEGPLGRVYRGIERKAVLHLALLIHDLGKGFEEDHSLRGLRIAQQASQRLHLDAEEAETIAFLVLNHLRMNHLAFRRDTSDQQLIVQFAVDVGLPEWLQMLYVFTAADLSAVGPDVWTGWKAELLTDLYHRAMQTLAGESPSTSRGEYHEQLRDEVREALGLATEGASEQRDWLHRHLESLPIAYLNSVSPQQIAEDLRLLANLGPHEVKVEGRYQPETGTVQFTIGTTEDIAPGIFHRLTGALTSQGLEILSAQIHTLADRLVLDRFWVVDRDFAGPPPPERLEQIQQALVDSLQNPAETPKFRRTWRLGGTERPFHARPQDRVLVDNHTSGDYTILDIFTVDRRGLLYAIAQTLFELGYSVWRAKIGTYLDQVVDVFYVTDQQGRKVDDPARLQHTRERLLEVLQATQGD